MKMRDTFALLLVAAVFGVLRFVVPVTGAIDRADIFKDLAHIFVGFLFGYAVGKKRWELWAIAWGLTALELTAFLTRRG